jgi:UDP-glucose 4-epimerase
VTQGLTVLVTGGSGYIGSHTCVALIQRGHEVVVVDDYSNSSPEALVRVRDLTDVTPTAYEVDIRDRAGLAEVFSRRRIDVVIHFAAKKSVPESTQIPLEYFDINLAGTINLLRVMHQSGVHRLVYSSSCSLYGDGHQRPLTESDVPGPTNPYAWTKWAGEQIIEQACRFHPDLAAISLRYFNPIGAHQSGLLGEAATGPVFNVMPLLTQVASGQQPELTIFGTDYPTVDGTAIRDYIHVLDVAEAHVVALDHIDDSPGMQVFNLGTGVGTSVMQLRNAFGRASGREIPFVARNRRPGDVAMLIADPGKVAAEWNWHTVYDLNEMCRDAWRFHCQNPHGYVTRNT